MKKTFGALFLLTILPFALQAQLITGFSGGDDLSVGPGTAGYDFTVGPEPLSIAALGILDVSGTGLTASHTVGLWDNTPSHNLLGSVEVTPASQSLSGGWFFANLTQPITLSAGTTYTLGATYADVDFDQAKGNATSVTTTGISLGDARLSTGTGFEFPDVNVAGANSGFFGPNANFVPVPEPSKTGLAVAGFLFGLALYRRWLKCWG